MSSISRLTELACLAAFLILAPYSYSMAEDSEQLKTKTVAVGEFFIDRPYASMKGPTKTESILLDPSSKTPYLWIKSFSVEIFDADGNRQSSEYLCHAWAHLPTKGNPESALLTISEGLPEMRFPDGYAMKIPNTSDAKIMLLGQVRNDNPHISKHLSMKFTLTYFDDTEAQKLGLVPLVSTTVNTAPTDVLPGKHIYTAQVPQHSLFMRNGNIYFIKMHLHPYGQSVELFDDTAQATVWKGTAENIPGRDALARTDAYSDSQGLKIHKDHKYKVITTYNNTSGHVIDAMGVLRVYFAASAADEATTSPRSMDKTETSLECMP